jgi:hypothetical protein
MIWCNIALMEAHYKTANGRLTFKIEAQDVKALFRQLSSIQQSLEADSSCGLCNSKDIGYNVRVHDENEYFELICAACGAKFSFGQHKKGGTLFPKRQSGTRGWNKWKAESQSGEYEPPFA